MIKDIDQSYTSWLIYSDYLEENNQLNLAEQIRFELDYKLASYPPPFGGGGDDHVGSGGVVGGYIGFNTASYVGGGGDGVGIGGLANAVSSVGGCCGVGGGWVITH